MSAHHSLSALQCVADVVIALALRLHFARCGRMGVVVLCVCVQVAAVGSAAALEREKVPV